MQQRFETAFHSRLAHNKKRFVICYENRDTKTSLQ